MAYTNRHEHFIGSIDTELDKISGLEILKIFNLDSWMEYSFPFAHTELSPEIINYRHEDYGSEFEGNQEFVVWVGVDDDNGDDLRNAYGSLVLLIEKAFKKYNIPNLTTSDFKLYIKSTKIKGIYPVLSGGDTKYLFLVNGEIHYELTWL